MSQKKRYPAHVLRRKRERHAIPNEARKAGWKRIAPKNLPGERKKKTYQQKKGPYCAPNWKKTKKNLKNSVEKQNQLKMGGTDPITRKGNGSPIALGKRGEKALTKRNAVPVGGQKKKVLLTIHSLRTIRRKEQ